MAQNLQRRLCARDVLHGEWRRRATWQGWASTSQGLKIPCLMLGSWRRCTCRRLRSSSWSLRTCKVPSAPWMVPLLCVLQEVRLAVQIWAKCARLWPWCPWAGSWRSRWSRLTWWWCPHYVLGESTAYSGGRPSDGGVLGQLRRDTNHQEVQWHHGCWERWAHWDSCALQSGLRWGRLAAECSQAADWSYVWGHPRRWAERQPGDVQGWPWQAPEFPGDQLGPPGTVSGDRIPDEALDWEGRFHRDVSATTIFNFAGDLWTAREVQAAGASLV